MRILVFVAAAAIPLAFVGCTRTVDEDHTDLSELSVTLYFEDNEPVDDLTDRSRAEHITFRDCDANVMLDVLENAPKVRRLMLGGRSVDDAVMDKVATLSKLQFLRLYDTNVTDAGFSRLSDCKSLIKLEVLVCRNIGGGVGDVISRLPLLEELVLSHTSINDKCIPDDKPLSQLRRLHLEGPGITDRGWERIHAPNLRVLWLEGTRVSNDGFANLRRFPLLEELSVGLNNVTVR